MYLGFDISTSCVGWSILDKNGNYVDGGFIDFSPKKLNLEKSLFLKMNHFEKTFFPILEKYKSQITEWAVEEAVKKFTMGRSSAGTIFKLASFNFGVVYSVYKKLQIEPTYISANAARKICDIKFTKDIDKDKKKQYIFDRCRDKYKNANWQKNRNDVFAKQCYDQSDAIVITEALFKSKCQKKKQSKQDIQL